ncbi:hypothetical protein KJ359_000022 [Pestalotiopsis sp. 9143b]|nr:hypothetical protein KJ359_000022 [Pestalotiopsis sp. 9143b]
MNRKGHFSYDAATYWTSPARNFRSSARLHLQHFLFQNTLGYHLETHVQESLAGAQELKVADLACGNGVWLNELAGQLAGKGIAAGLKGYDINPANFPAPAFLPSTVELKTLDVLSTPLQQKLIGAFDVVHVRAFASIIVNSNITPLLTAALSLLKPGGWLQWEETKADRFLVQSPSPEVTSTACDTISHILKASGEARGLDAGFIEHLDKGLADHGFHEVQLTRTKKREQDYKAWTEGYLMVLEELWVHFPSAADSPQAPMTRESWLDLFGKAVHETEQGVAIHQD